MNNVNNVNVDNMDVRVNVGTNNMNKNVNLDNPEQALLSQVVVVNNVNGDHVDVNNENVENVDVNNMNVNVTKTTVRSIEAIECELQRAREREVTELLSAREREVLDNFSKLPFCVYQKGERGGHAREA